MLCWDATFVASSESRSSSSRKKLELVRFELEWRTPPEDAIFEASVTSAPSSTFSAERKLLLFIFEAFVFALLLKEETYRTGA